MEKKLPQRKRLRLPKYDYSSVGYYFITVCTKDKACVLGTIIGQVTAPSVIRLSNTGKIVEEEFHALEERFPHVTLDKYCVMPNHIHMIVRLASSEEGEAAGASPRPTRNIPQMIGEFKSVTTRRRNERYGTRGIPLWQASYYDHVIRNEADYLRIWQYIEDNPEKWADDQYYTPERDS